MIIFGWRHFNEEIGQRTPGDWEVINSQRTIAVHAMKNPCSSDVGVYMCCRLLRELVRGEARSDTTRPMSEDREQTLHSFGQDSTLRMPHHLDPKADQNAIKEKGRKVYAIMAKADDIASTERTPYIKACLDELDGALQDAAE